MIKLSTKGRYGTRVMLNLASRYFHGNEPVVLQNIAEEEEISIRYLKHIIDSLRIARLVKSYKGPGRGYILARSPAEIKIIEIIEAMEGPICLVDCVDHDDFCHRKSKCATIELWSELSNIITEYFEKKTLQELLNISEKKVGERTI